MLSSPSFPIKTSSSVNSSISADSKPVTSGLSPSPFNVSSPGPPTKRSLPYPPLRTADVTPELLLFSESSSESQSGSGSGSESEMQISVSQQAGLSDGFPVQKWRPRGAAAAYYGWIIIICIITCITVFIFIFIRTCTRSIINTSFKNIVFV